MILTCPNCTTSYEIADTSLGPAGRNVRCAACKTQWHATKPDEPIDLPLSAVPKATDQKKSDPKPVKAKELPRLYSEMIEDKKRSKAMMTQGIVWGGLAATFVAILALGYFLRVDIVRAFPGVANAYAMAGLKVNAAGLEFVNYKVAPSFKGGRFVVSVSAEVRNLRDEDTPVPPVRAKILDADNRTIETILVPSNGLIVAPHATRTLVFDVPDAKNMASSLELMFDLVAMKQAGQTVAHHGGKADDHGAPEHGAPEHGTPEHGTPEHGPSEHGTPVSHEAPAEDHGEVPQAEVPHEEVAPQRTEGGHDDLPLRPALPAEAHAPAHG